jgi:ATP-dependent Clp protease adapter protein ClpS
MSDTSTATAILPETAPPRPLRGWAVLLHNDDINEIGFVVRTVVEIARLPVAEALERTIEADASGLALVLVTHRERAELIQEQFQSRGLTVTIEPAA